MSWGHLSISAISQLLLARFGSNFKQRVLGTYTIDYNCPHNICPGNICPYQQYLSCHWPNFDQTLNKWSLEHIQQITTVTTTFVKTNICPGDICPYQQYYSCYWPDLDQTLNKGSWEHIQQITTVTTTFVQATFVLGTFIHISSISISKLNTFDFSLVFIWF